MALAPLSDDVKNMSYTELKARVEVLTRRVNSLTQMKISIIGSDQKPSITITETNSTLSIPEATDCSSEVAALEAEIVALEAEIVALEIENQDLQDENDELQDILDGLGSGVTAVWSDGGAGDSTHDGFLSVSPVSLSSHRFTFLWNYSRNNYGRFFDSIFLVSNSTGIFESEQKDVHFPPGSPPVVFSETTVHDFGGTPAKNTVVDLEADGAGSGLGSQVYADGVGGWGLSLFP